MAQIVAADQNWNTIDPGRRRNYLTVREWPVDSGRSFTVSDVRASAKVCLLGSDGGARAVRRLDPVGS